MVGRSGLAGALPPIAQGEFARDHTTPLSLPLPSLGRSKWTLRPPLRACLEQSVFPQEAGSTQVEQIEGGE